MIVLCKAGAKHILKGNNLQLECSPKEKRKEKLMIVFKTDV